ncbi:MAG: hypothetical protein K2I18_09365 [Paramuribaculum sp.]|nr:hypothetical protein [Paramuribaculum sp.]
MSLIHSLKRAFGLSEDYDTEDEIAVGDDAEAFQTYTPEPQPQKPPVKQIDSTALSADIFESVVALFNESQPEFIKKCLATDAQKAYILESIDAAVRQRLDAAIQNARLHGQCLWEEERMRLDCEVETLKKEKKALEQNREESKTARLSAERQKRALTERVHDLETQILNLSAEKEQYILENRSMLNKLRVASLTGGADSEEIAEKIAELTSRAEAAESELKAANERAQESAAQQTPDNADADIAAAKDAVKNDIIAALLKKYGDLQSRANKADMELDSALADIKSLMTLKDEVQRVQEIIDKKDARIAALKREKQQHLDSIADAGKKNEALMQEIESLKAQIAQLNSTIADNIADNAKLMQEKQQQQRQPAQAAQPKKKASRRGAAKPRISAIDELIDSTDWLVATPPMPLPKETEKEDDFGYKDPQRKTHSEDDRQLSLW